MVFASFHALRCPNDELWTGSISQINGLLKKKIAFVHGICHRESKLELSS